jgi:predicted component of type VI protein secretion system
MQSPSFRLIVRRGPQPNQVYELTAEVSNLGRDITNDIVINDREVSRHHLRLTPSNDGLTIEDLGSTNGTFVNGKRVTGTSLLKNGDMLGLGETVTLQFEMVRPGAVAQPPAAQAPAPLEPAADERFRPQEPKAAPVPRPEPVVSKADPYQQVQPAAQQQYQPPEAYAPPQDYYGQQGGQAAAYGPPPPGYDYDPYAMRDGESNTMQWVLIGCLGLLLLCCCMTVVLAVAIDTFCLYDYVPGLSDIIRGVTSIFPNGPYLPKCGGPLG